MWDRISYTWGLMRSSWDILKQDKTLLLFPLLSGLCCLLVLASFAVPMWVTGFWQPPARAAAPAQQVAYYGVLFVFYFCNYFVITFFNTGIVACAIRRMRGESATFTDGMALAFSQIHLIAGWALVSASVGLILRIIEDRSAKIGAIVAGLLGMAFTVVSFLVVPVLVAENKGPFAALATSTKLLRKTWGDQLVGNFSFGLVFFVLGIPAFILIGVGVFLAVGAGGGAMGLSGLILCGAIGVLYLVILSLIQSALQSIFQAAVYFYSAEGAAPVGFEMSTMRSAMRTK
ncbi:MAG: DUF6159 family protein [Phycisphaerae bacterium]